MMAKKVEIKASTKDNNGRVLRCSFTYPVTFDDTSKTIVSKAFLISKKKLNSESVEIDYFAIVSTDKNISVLE
jgi:hypothetical protein